MATATATASKTKIKFRPLDDRLVVAPHEADEKTSGGIILPDTAREKPQRGTVISTGPGKMLDTGSRASMDVKVGDSVYYGKYSGTEIEYGGDNFVVLRESDILAVTTD